MNTHKVREIGFKINQNMNLKITREVNLRKHKVTRVSLVKKGLSSVVSTFFISSFKKGEGVYYGNLLRRALLSELDCVAIRGVRFPGQRHEFARISGVDEDIVDLMLNLEQVYLVGTLKESRRIYTIFTKRGMMQAKDLTLPDGLKVACPNQYIANVNRKQKRPFVMELFIKRGRGFCCDYPEELDDVRRRPTDCLPHFFPMEPKFIPVDRKAHV